MEQTPGISPKAQQVLELVGQIKLLVERNAEHLKSNVDNRFIHTEAVMESAARLRVAEMQQSMTVPISKALPGEILTVTVRVRDEQLKYLLGMHTAGFSCNGDGWQVSRHIEARARAEFIQWINNILEG